MKFIRFVVPDPDYKGLQNEAIIALEHIVRIIPRYYQQDEKGQKFLASPIRLTEEKVIEGYSRDFHVYDMFGNEYSSAMATDAGRRLIEELWNGAI